VDIVEGLPQGKALDMLQSAPILRFRRDGDGDERLRGHGGFRHRGHHSGLARKPGMSRDDLLKVNAGIVKT
jgi:malate dehydrogenase